MTDRISSVETAFTAGLLAAVETLSGMALLIAEDGAPIGGNAGFRDLGDGCEPFWMPAQGVAGLQDVTGSDQPVYRLLTLPDGKRVSAIYTRVAPGPDATPLILIRQDQRNQVMRGFKTTHRGLLRSKEEREKANAIERRLREEATHWRRLSMTDRMTGLLNMTGFRDAASAALDTYGGGVLLYADLNGFKAVNDTLGHAAGDELLRDVAGSLAHVFRASDVIGRLGGDEFAILLAECDASDVEPVTARLRDAMARRFPVDRGPDLPAKVLHVSAAMGHAVYPDDAENLEELIRIADARMYVDKRRWTDLRRNA